MSYVDETSSIDRKWLLDVCNGAGKCVRLSDGNIRLPPARLSFAHVREPKRIEPKNPGEQVKFLYQASFVFPWELTLADFKVLEDACDDLAIPKYGPNWRANKKLYRPLKEQVENVQTKSGERWPGYNPTGYYISVSAGVDRPPVLQDTKGNVVADTSIFQNGCWVLPIVNPYLLKTESNHGVTVGFNGLVYLAEDNSFGAGAINPSTAAAGLDALSAPPPVFGGGLIED
jgi:Protein of unknown function (DUF2815).